MRLSPVLKVSLAVFGVIVLGLVALAVFGSAEKTPPPAAAAPAASAHITMIHGRRSDNSCAEAPGEARIYVTITLRNSGDASGTVDPWAAFEYSDGGNSSDSYTTNWGHDLTVPAHSVRDADFYHTYNPQQHAVIRCTGYADLASEAGGYALPAG